MNTLNKTPQTQFEQRHWKVGMFKFRLPFIHYRLEWPEYVQGLLMCATCLSALAVLEADLGMPTEVALAIVILNGFFYCWHVMWGDPVVPGWITPAIPLLEAYCISFAAGPERVQGLIAFELELGIFCIVLGVTGLAGKLIALIPAPIKSGIILGAGIAAIMSIFKEDGYFAIAPITITICLLGAAWLMFSGSFENLAAKYKGWKFIAQLGILPTILLGAILGPITGESEKPVFDSVFSHPDFIQLWDQWTAWGAHGVGWPSAAMWLSAIPTVISIYIVLFGDVVQSQSLIADACKIRGEDEIVDYNPNRAHIIFGFRNAIMAIIGPDICMCGPLWAAMQVVVCERYKKGKEAVQSIFSGAGSFRWGTFTGYWIGPIVAIVVPIKIIAMAQTMFVQGFVSVRIGITQSRSFKDIGIAGVIAGVIVCKNAAWGLIVGIILTFVCYDRNFLRGDVKSGKIWSPEVEKLTEASNQLITK